MAGKQAKVLFDHHVQALLAYSQALSVSRSQSGDCFAVRQGRAAGWGNCEPDVADGP